MIFHNLKPTICGLAVIVLLTGLSASVFAQSVTLSGVVIDEKSEAPIAGAKVELTNANAGTGYFVTHTGEDGRFAFTQVRAGLQYDLGVIAEGYCPYEMQRWSAPTNQTAVDLTLPLVEGAVIGGTVTTSDGETPLQNVQITLTFESGDFQMLDRERTLYTDKDGRFQFAQIPPNQYRLTFRRGGFIGEEIVGIRPQQGDKKVFSVKLYKPGSISGTVMLDENSSPLSNIEMAARGASQRAGTTDENGFFTIGSLKPGVYELYSHPAGFYPYRSSQSIQLREGENYSDEEIRLTPLSPAMSVSVRREVFLPDQDLIFQVRTFRIGQYECDIHSIPASVFLDKEIDIRRLVESADLSSYPVALHWTEDVDFRNPYIWMDKNVKTPQTLNPGAYVLRIQSSGDAIESRLLFFVTRLGIVVKRGEKNTFVYATDLKTSMPVENAQVRVVSRTLQRKKFPGWTETLAQQPQRSNQWDGQTNEQGIVMIQHEYPDPMADVIAVSPDGHLAVSQLNQSYLIQSQSKTIYPYTDRPVYRPGHTVYYKSIFREKEERDYRIPVNQKAIVSVRNSEGKEIYAEEHLINDWGSINGSFSLAQDAPLGRYNLAVKLSSDVQNTIRFYVEEYRKPEFQVEVEPERSFYINGEMLAFNLQAEYYFGAPVPNAEVRYRLYESYAAGGSRHDYPSSYSTFLTSGKTQTDAEGMARIEFLPSRASRDRRVTAEIDVIEASGRQVSGSAGVPVGVGKYYITAQPTRNVFDRETPLQVEIQTLTHDDKVVSASVEVDFIQEIWNPVRRRYERPSRPQASRTGITDEEGRLLIEWLPDADISGRIDVVIRSVDDEGNRINASTRVWRMAFRAGSFDLQYPTLEGILDKDSYEPGEEATLLINTNYPENPVILTIEGRDILMHRVIWPAAKTTAVAIPILPDYAPNVYVGLFMPRGVNLSTRTYNLNVPQRRGDLNIEVHPDREKYKPGESGEIFIKTTLPDGTPTASELSLAVVDEAIFAIRSDHTPNIHSSFYDRQSNWVITTFSYPLQYYGGANKGVRPDIRKDFRDTALWEANVYTGENGLGSVKITYPDNLTTWRLTARAHTKNSEVGWTKSKSLVTKDIVARLSLPRFFTENDRLKIPTLVNNLSGVNLPDIQTRLTVEGGVKLNESNEKKTQAAAGAAARENWDASVTADSPAATFVFEAQSPQDSDALQLSAPVLPLGYQFTRFQTGKISKPVIQLETTLDDNIRLSQSNVQIRITPSLASAALGAIPFLTDFPYGCVEQTLNGFLPNLLLLHTLDDLGALSPEDRKALEQIGPKVEKSLNRLYSMQKYNGAWGWFSSSPEDLFLTAMVVHGLKQVDMLGYPVDENRFKRGVQYLQSNISNTRIWDSQAYAAYVLSEALEADPPMLNELHVNRNELYEFGLSVSALALHNRGKDAEANEILDLLMSRLTTISEHQSAWNASPDRRWDWYGSASETNAWGLKALVALRGVTPEAEKIVQWLMAQRWGERWRSTRETAVVVDALRCVIQQEAKEEGLSDLEYAISVNEEIVKKGSITKNQFTQKVSMPLPLQLGDNAIELQFNRPQGYWSLNESLFRQGEVHQPAPHSEFGLTRLYERAIHTRDYRGRPKILTEGYSPDDALNTGQEILITLVIQSKQEIPHLIVEDPLPSGCEVIESFLEQGRSSWRPYSHYERRDQKMVFFLDNIPKGETRIEYLMRAELQGVFRANPAHAWCMYDPLYSAHSAGNRLLVK